eukprot:2639885-Amphidinium_carterae.2
MSLRKRTDTSDDKMSRTRAFQIVCNGLVKICRRTETSSLAHGCLEQPARALEGLQHDLWPGHDWQPHCVYDEAGQAQGTLQACA